MSSPSAKQESEPGLAGLLADAFEAPRELFAYETIKFSGRLEFPDGRGVALFSRHQRIRFLEDGVTTYFDAAWGEGVLFAHYSANTRIIDAIPTRKGYVLALALPRPYKKGEIFDIRISRRIVGSFLDDHVYWDTAMRVPTELLTLDIVSPSDRRIRQPQITAPPQGDFDALESPRRLRLRVEQPALHTPYTLRWVWK